VDRVQVAPRGDGVRRCPYCREDLPPTLVRPCEDCGAAYHRDCWTELGGCGTLGCVGLEADTPCATCRGEVGREHLILACRGCRGLHHAECAIPGSDCRDPKCGGTLEFLKAKPDWTEPPLRYVPPPRPPPTCADLYCHEPPLGRSPPGHPLVAALCARHARKIVPPAADKATSLAVVIAITLVAVDRPGLFWFLVAVAGLSGLAAVALSAIARAKVRAWLRDEADREGDLP